MAKLDLEIDFRKFSNHIELVKIISPSFYLKEDDEINITIQLKTNNQFLYSDMLLVIVAAIRYLKYTKVKVSGRVFANQYDSIVNYASRVNFFQQLGLDFEEAFNRNSSKGKFTEIEIFDKNNIYELQDELGLILHQCAEIKLEVLQMLYWCLNEIMDNVLVHSKLETGWVSAQMFPSRKEIRLIICDTGIGIHKALTTYPGSKYNNITEKEALELCILNRVTNGAGMGFGLFASSEFIKENKGEMLIYSGNYHLNNKTGKFEVNSGDFWPGTFVFLNIKTDVPVDYKKILPAHHSLPIDYQEFIEKVFGIDENLW